MLKAMGGFEIYTEMHETVNLHNKKIANHTSNIDTFSPSGYLLPIMIRYNMSKGVSSVNNQTTLTISVCLLVVECC